MKRLYFSIVVAASSIFVPRTAFALTPLRSGPTLLETTSRLVTFMATLAYIVLPFLLLFAIIYILWRYWKKKPTKKTFLILGLLVMFLFVFLLFEWVLRSIVFS